MTDKDRQRVEWETYSDEELGQGRCPYSGEDLKTEMDWWNRRVLMCDMCDCFGYPLVMSDFDPDKPLPPEFGPSGDLTDGVLDW